MEENCQELSCQEHSPEHFSEKSVFVVESAEWISEDVVKITSSENSSFFVRFLYCETAGSDCAVPGFCLNTEQLEDLLYAGECFAAEQAAVKYLARCEQCEQGLFLKLLNKKFSSKAATAALQYLKEKKYLSDKRFARSWLRNRSITQLEGSVRLKRELLKRGIDREIAENAVSEFLSENPEEDILIKAVEKCKKTGKSGQAAVRYLLNKGFSYSQIKKKVTMV